MTGQSEIFKPLSKNRVLPSWPQTKMVQKFASMTSRNNLKFLDLFSGLGGFHLALSPLGCECVFASEIDKGLQELYQINHGIKPSSDIRFAWKDVPAHDILCARFPCQPFSKAGSRKGFECADSGDLFDYILKVVDRHGSN